MTTGLDDVNRRIWSRDAEIFAADDSWTDRGERNALLAIADEIRNQPLLDVGVGAGRSTWLLRLLSSRYVAVDYTPEMVELCRRIHPGVDVRVADARDLSQFADGSLGFVMFSCNGIDAVGHADRAEILREFFRVLRPGGLLLFSTMDRAGRAYLSPPWRLGPHRDLVHFGRFVALLPRNLKRYCRSYPNWFRLRRRSEDHGSWAIAPLSAHDYGLLIHYITVAEQARVVRELGYEVLDMYADNGQRIDPEEPREVGVCFHTVARRPRLSA